MSERAFQSIAEIIAFAVDREIDAAETYGRMADIAKTPGLRELLIVLRQEEEGHRRLLEELTAERIAGLAPSFVPDLRVSDYLVEETPGGDMSLQDLLIFAAKKEHKSVELYTALARGAAASGQARLFEFLAGQERAHKLKLEAEYEKHILQEN